MAGYQYLLVARHARADKLSAAHEVAQRLVDTLEELAPSKWPMQVTDIEHSDTDASRHTAEIFADALGVPARTGDVALGPKQFPPYAPARVNDQAPGDPVETSWVRIEKRLLKTPSTVLLLVGHQPAIDWLLADDRVDGAVALAPGELACLARRTGADGAKWHLWWMVTPSEAAAIESLRQKISSKMTVLSVLAGFTLAVIGAVLVALPDDTVPRLLAAGATACFAFAAAMYVCVLLAYDELMMPHRFWRAERKSLSGRGPSSPGPVARPPSSAGIVLYQHMVALWRWAMAALVLSGVGVTLLGVSAAAVNSAIAAVAVAVLGVVLGIAVRLWWARIKPHLGTDD
jgi:phosphohistidine phosphatase SixA